MTRLQKKCFVFSVGLHGLLAAILFFSAGFRTRPEDADLQVLSMIPANILDRVGGGTPAPRLPRPPEPIPPSEVVGRVEYPKPMAEEQEVRPRPAPKQLETPQPTPLPPRETSLAQRSAKPAPRHEIHPSYTPATRTPNTKTTDSSEAAEAAQAASQAELKRLRQVEQSLSQLAAGVQSSAAEKTTVDVPGLGGAGEVFAGYKNVVISIYRRAWITPDSVADRTPVPVARVVVARDGTILSAELITPSGDSSLDKSVDRALRRVTKLPPFPAGATEEERAFQIQFNLDAKKASG
jgi:TonB family protein